MPDRNPTIPKDFLLLFMVTILMFQRKVSVVFVCLFHSDELEEKELEIKLDITKKSRKINRPFSFIDQHGE